MILNILSLDHISVTFCNTGEREKGKIGRETGKTKPYVGSVAAAFLNNLKGGQKFSDLPKGHFWIALDKPLENCVRKKLEILYKNAGCKQKPDPGREGKWTKL